MKKITVLFSLFLISFNQYTMGQTPQLEELLERYQEIPPNGNALTAYFSIDEIEILRSHLISLQEETRGSDDGVTVFGNNVAFDVFFSFNTNDPETVDFIAVNSSSGDFESAGDIDPTNLNSAYVLTLGLGELYELNIATATYTFMGLIAPPGNESWTGVEFDPINNILYGISSDFTNASSLSIIDIPNLTANPVGVTGMPGAIAIAFDGSENLYGYDVSDDSFYTIDPTTGQATLIGPIGFDASFAQDLEWDPTSGTMFMTAFDNGTANGELRTVDLTTGSTTFVSSINSGANGQVSWASIPNDGTLSIDDPQQSIDFTFYPNPAQQSITLSAATRIDNVTIFNVLGQEVLQKDIDATTGQLTIDALENGLYIMQISSNNQVITERFIKN